MSFLSLAGIEKSFGATSVLSGIDIEAAEGEILALLGPSGSGKTTLLRLIAGFESPDRGRIDVGGDPVGGLSPAQRRFGMVFQHFALFPHLDVAGNIRFGLTGRDWTAGEAEQRIEEVLALVDLEGYGERRVDQLSGGQQQRVALARALAPRPRVLLLDEPLSNLDPALRERTRREIRDAVRAVGITAVWVTHEQEEAFTVGDRVAVVNAGRIEQVGTPEDLYDRPQTRFVAFFVGRASALPGRVIEGGVRLGTRGEGKHWPGVGVEELTVGQNVDIVVRPEQLEFELGGESVPGEVVSRRFAGATTLYGVRLAELGTVEVAASADAARRGDGVAVRVRPGVRPPHLYPRSSG